MTPLGTVTAGDLDPDPRTRYARAGLLKGRVQMKGRREPSKALPTFDDALQMATTDDLMWALKLLIKHPNAKRTWRDHRIKHIDKRLREIMAAADGSKP